MNGKSKKIGAVERTFQIIDTITELEGASAVEIADYLDSPMSTIYDHLETIANLGWITKRDGKYYLSTQFYRRGLIAKSQYTICDVSKDPLRKLAIDSGEHSSLMIEEDGHGVFLHIEKSKESLRSVLPPGTKTPLHSNAPGKAILAFMNSERVQHIINQYGLTAETDATITEKEEFYKHLENIKKREYAVDDEEGVPGLQGIAVPILERTDGDIVGAISIYTPANKNISQFEDEMLALLQQAKNTIEINLSYS